MMRIVTIGASALCAMVAFAGTARMQSQAAPAPASISGRVFESTSPTTPVRRVFVSATGEGLSSPRGAVTDDRGEFVITGLPPGRFMITASKPAYQSISYGTKAAGRPGTPVAVAAGESVTNITIMIARAAVITGVVRDQTGEPAPGVSVAAVSTRLANQPSRSETNTGIVTDNLGRYRIYGLEPGEYVVAAAPSRLSSYDTAIRRDAEVDAILADLKRGTRTLPALDANGVTGVPAYDRAMQAPRAYVPIFHPSAWSAATATRVTLSAGEVRDNVDIQMQLVRTVIVRGSVTGAADLPAGSLTLALATFSVPLPLAFGLGPQSTNLRPDGSFELTAVLPGSYLLRAETRPGGRGGTTAAPARMYAETELVVGENDLNNVSLTLQPAPTMSGSVVFEAAASPVNPAVVAIGLTSRVPGSPKVISATVGVSPDPSSAAVAPDGTFTLPGIIPGSYRLTTFNIGAGVPKGWWLRSARAGERDLLDDGVVIAAGQDLTGVVLTYSNRRTELSGVLQTGSTAGATDYSIVAFTTNRDWWRPGARRVVLARPGTDGRFVFADLPPGEYYLAALSGVAGDEWQQPAFLAQLVGSSAQVNIGEGEKKIQDLKLK